MKKRSQFRECWPTHWRNFLSHEHDDKSDGLMKWWIMKSTKLCILHNKLQLQTHTHTYVHVVETKRRITIIGAKQKTQTFHLPYTICIKIIFSDNKMCMYVYVQNYYYLIPVSKYKTTHHSSLLAKNTIRTIHSCFIHYSILVCVCIFSCILILTHSLCKSSFLISLSLAYTSVLHENALSKRHRESGRYIGKPASSRQRRWTFILQYKPTQFLLKSTVHHISIF